MVTYFNRKDLIKFGEYLSSKERIDKLVIPENRDKVTQADVDNYIINTKRASYPEESLHL